jgi:hypothetical protein
MSEIKTRVEVDCSTGIQTEVPLTAEELIEYEKMAVIAQKQIADMHAAEEAQALAKTSAVAKLTALGLTEEEAKALIS